MIQERLVFRAKYGRANELVALIKEGNSLIQKAGYPPGQVLTDVTGQMFTVVWERQLPSLGEWERLRQLLFALPEFGPWFARMQELVESGRREIYNVE